MKAVCVLESILRKNDDEKFSVIASYFSENNDAVIRCSESPQNSLREKANKVCVSLQMNYGFFYFYVLFLFDRKGYHS